MKSWAELGIDVPSHAGGEAHTTCPRCSRDRKKKRAKCLSVNLDEGVFCCHHCGWSGSLKQGGQDARELHWRKPEWRRPAPIELSQDDRMLAWFASRGITEEVVRRNGITATTVYMPQVEEEVRAIAFPYLRGDQLVNHKYRDAHKNFRMDTGAERILYGLNDLAAITIIVEGELDKLAVEVAGFRACVSVPDGAPTPDSKDYSGKFDFLAADMEAINAVGEWVLAVDNDPAGQRLEDELARRLGREKCLRVTWTEGCKDANEVLMKHGPTALADALSQARPYPVAGVFEVAELADSVLRLYENGWEKGVSTGWPSLDEYYTVRPGEFTVVTGIPNSGKSNWLDALTVNLAKQHGWKFAVFSPENQPIEDHVARIVEKYAGKPFGTGPNARMTRDELRDALAWAHRHFYWVLPDDDSEWTMKSVLSAAKALVARHGIRGLIVDPWNELEHARDRDLSETEYISQSLKHFRQFGRTHGVHAWMVAHPAKLYREKDGNYPIPTLYDISGSAHWRNKADNGICVWRDFKDGSRTVQIHVQKIRFRQIGKVGMAELEYQGKTQTYAEPSHVIAQRGNSYRHATGGE